MMHNEQRQSAAFSYGPFVWWMGMAIDRMDPEKLGRIRVRVYGYHAKDTSDIGDTDLFWAVPILPTTSASLSGVGYSPTGIVEGTTVIGFFADGHAAQHPVIFGTLPGNPSTPDESSGGFRDPNGKYPKFPDESDCNRLSRNEKINETCVKTKRDNIDECDIATFSESASRSTWKEKETAYSANYPFNHTYESESGHIVEYDDTEGSERMHRWHRKGTFEEIHPDGTEVKKIVKDKYEIVMGDDFCHIHGNCKVTIDGDAHLLVKGKATIDCASDLEHIVRGDYKLKVMGNYDVEVKNNATFDTTAIERHTASLIFLN